MTDELKTVARFSDIMGAEIAAGMLRSNGIEAEMFGQDSSYPCLNVVYDRVELKVKPEDYESARNLLAANESAE